MIVEKFQRQSVPLRREIRVNLKEGEMILRRCENTEKCSLRQTNKRRNVDGEPLVMTNTLSPSPVDFSLVRISSNKTLFNSYENESEHPVLI